MDTMRRYEISTTRIAAIAELANVSFDDAYEIIHADWDNATEHQAWLDSASDEEIASWVVALMS